MNNQVFAERIKYLRAEKGIGQVELAKNLGVSKGNISYWERGLKEPSMHSLIQLAKFFGVTIDYIVGLSDD